CQGRHHVAFGRDHLAGRRSLRVPRVSLQFPGGGIGGRKAPKSLPKTAEWGVDSARRCAHTRKSQWAHITRNWRPNEESRAIRSATYRRGSRQGGSRTASKIRHCGFEFICW